MRRTAKPTRYSTTRSQRGVITPSERDYGWDYIVEFFKERQSTGVMFAGQLKGSRHTKNSADGSFISQPLEQDAADYRRALRLAQVSPLRNNTQDREWG